MEKISAVFQSCLNPNDSVRKEAEKILNEINLDTNTLLTFFTYISQKNIDLNLRKSACVFLKGYLKDYWFNDSDKALANPQKQIQENVKSYFKENIINLLLSVEQGLIPLLKEMVICIVRHANGYNLFWPELMGKLRQVLDANNFANSNEIYHLISKVIRRYHIDSKSVELFDEIKKTIAEICPKMTEDGINYSSYLIKSNLGVNEKPCLVIMKRILQIFYSMNYQDFPEFFEDNLNKWMEIILNCLSFECNQNEIYDEVIELKSKAMKCVNLYFANYYDDFIDYTQQYYPIVWKLNFISKKADSFSKLTRELLDFYRVNIQYRRIQNLKIEDVNTLIQNLIIPNLKMTEGEYDEFTDNPIAYLKIELEEADMDSNKYYAINLLKNLISLYPDITGNFLGPMIQKLLDNYYSNKESNWNDKILAINIIFAVVIKNFAQRIGVTELNPNAKIDLSNLISEVFTKEFQKQPSPIISQVYSMKFLTTFRLQIPVQFLTSVIEMLIGILNGSEKICQSACLLTLEKILFMRDLNTRVPLSKDAVNNQTTFSNLVSSLVKFISNDTNIFAMRCFYRTLFLTDEIYYKSMIESLTTTIQSILKGILVKSQEDEFNFYFFETCALIIRKVSSIDIKIVSYFESVIRNELNSVLTNNITDLMGYTLQFFALYVHLINDQSEFYSKLLQSILYNMDSWNLSMKYMFNPFIAYIKVNFTTNKTFFSSPAVMEQLFKICNILLSLKCYSQLFELLDYIINLLDFANYGVAINNLIISSYKIYAENIKQNPKTSRDLGKELILFIAKLIVIISPENTLQIVNQIGGFDFLNQIADLFSYIDDNKNKKIMLYGYCQMITQFVGNINEEIIKSLVKKLIEVVQTFYKINFNLFSGRREAEDISYAAHNYNKLTNANISFEFKNYLAIQKMDEGNILFTAMNAIKEKTGINLVSVVISNLKPRDAENIRNLARKNNYSL